MTISVSKNWISAETYTPGMVSVIIPNYNHGRYLADAIDSVLEQTYSSYEIIVIDDGSTDNSREVAERYGDKIVYIYKENAGLSAARNTGILASKGEYIGLLDADDMYEPAFMETMVNALQSDSEAGGVYCGYQFVKDSGERMSQIENRTFPPEELYQTFWGANYWVPECVLMRRECYVTAGPYDESLRALEDWDVWLRILAKHRVVGLSDVLIRHRALPDSMSSDAHKMHTNRMAVMKNRFGTLDAPHPEVKDKIEWIYSNAFFISLIEYLQFGDEVTAFEMFERAVVADPTILERNNLYYELAVGSQPKGDRGDLNQLNLDDKEALLTRFINGVFQSDEIDLNPDYKDRANSLAYLNLSKLAYTTGKNRKARHFLHQVLTHDSSNYKCKSFWGLYGRTLLGTQIIGRFKGSNR